MKLLERQRNLRQITLKFLPKRLTPPEHTLEHWVYASKETRGDCCCHFFVLVISMKKIRSNI